MYLVISVDVEEEGLFSGKYPRVPPGVANVAHLRRLEFIPREFGFPLTLLATYPVVRDPAARAVLGRWREEFRGEIGVHLHPWSTPPFGKLPGPEPVSARLLSQDLLRGKLATLVMLLQKSLDVTPRALRMGRFDWDPRLLPLMDEFGLRVDSSMVPLRAPLDGPDHFWAPPDPFFLTGGGSTREPLLEVPLTMVPVWTFAPGGVRRLSAALPGPWGKRLRAGFRYLGAAGIHPVWFPAASMRLAVRLHRRRGGRVLTMFLHSSELMPGGYPKFPTETAVAGLVQKIRHFLAWLKKTGPVQGVTLSEVYRAWVLEAGKPAQEQPL
jgi:hypothetical protein